MKEMMIEDLTRSSDGIYVTIKRAKQRGPKLPSKYLIPISGSSNLPNYAFIVDQYLQRLKDDTNAISGPLFKTCKMSISRQNMGINEMYQLGVQIATLIKLPEPKRYTGHTFRRTAATVAADNGATCMDLMTHFGWQNPKMALRYVSNSKHQNKRLAKLLCPVVDENGQDQVNGDKLVNQNGEQILGKLLRKLPDFRYKL
jgi:integrase